ncbi:MAG: hypothetical protein ACTHMX_04160 [Thermomicrobiales bacterium]
MIVVSGVVAGFSCLTTSYLLGRRLVRARRTVTPHQAGMGALPDLDGMIASAPLVDPARDRHR